MFKGACGRWPQCDISTNQWERKPSDLMTLLHPVLSPPVLSFRPDRGASMFLS